MIPGSFTSTEEQEVTAPLELDELQQAWEEKGPAHPRCHALLVVAGKTDLGQVRENNEDKFDTFEPDDPRLLARRGRVYVVADGMGGHSAGQIAAELAINVFIRSYYAGRREELEEALQEAVREANSYIVEVARTVPARSGMGATLTAAVVRDDDMHIVQVGDSRCYLLRGGTLQLLTEDHSWVAEQVRSGAMSLEQAEQSPFRNVITRSMGGAAEVEADLYAVRLEAGDRFLLCSDGLSGLVPEEEIARLLGSGSPSSAAWTLVERANHYGGKDNITALVLHVEGIWPWPEAAPDEGRASANGQSTVADGAAGEPGFRRGLLGRLFRRG